MSFDWKQFLSSHNVDFVTKGANVGRNQINIGCPFCGSADPSHHLTISLAGKGWRCYRNPRQHSGVSPFRLVQALLQCSASMAYEIVGGAARPMPEDDDVATIVASRLGFDTPADVKPRHLTFPAEIKPLSSDGVFSAAFINYLLDRGYSPSDLEFLFSKYQLHYAWRGPWAWRVIIPIYDEREKLMTWTGRTIHASEKVRYKTLPSDFAVKPPTDLLLGLNFLWDVPKNNALVVCEGPFDAIRVTTLGWRDGVYGTCLFGLNISDRQADLLEDLSKRFKRTWMLLDSDAVLQMLRLRDYFPRGVRSAYLPKGIKDPGELNGEKGKAFLQSLT